MKTVLSGNTGHSPGQSARRCGRVAAAGLLGGTLLVGAAAPIAVAAVADDDMVDVTGLAAVTDDSLDRMRGGFSIGPYNVNFGLVIRTAINHQQILMTSFKVETLGKIQDLKHEWQTYLHDSTPGGMSGAGSSGSSKAGAQAASATPPVQNPAQVQGAVGGGLPATLEGALEPPPTQEAAQQMGEQVGEQTAEGVIGGIVDQAANAGGGPAAPNAADPGNASAHPGPAPEVDATVDFGGGFNVTQIPGGIIVDDGAGTAIMHQLDSGLTSTIVNIANGATVRQSTEMNVFVTNFSNVIGQHSLFQATSNMAFELARNNPLLGQ